MVREETDRNIQRARKLNHVYRPTVDSDLERTIIEVPDYRITIEHKRENPEFEKRKRLVV